MLLNIITFYRRKKSDELIAHDCAAVNYNKLFIFFSPFLCEIF